MFLANDNLRVDYLKGLFFILSYKNTYSSAGYECFSWGGGNNSQALAKLENTTIFWYHQSDNMFQFNYDNYQYNYLAFL